MSELDQPLRVRSRTGAELAADYRPGPGDTAVLLLHGFLSDRRAGGRFDRIADAYAAAGHAVLRIDFSGFGESDGDVVDGEALLADAHAALDLLDARGHTRQVLHGQSLGSAVALRVVPDRPAVRTLVLTGALTGAGSGDSPYPFLDAEQLAAWHRDEDVLLPITGSTRRRHVVVNRRRPKLGRNGTQQELLRAVPVPVLVIHGDTGEQERALAAITEHGRAWLPPGSEVVTLPGADHLFFDHLEDLSALATDWVDRRLQTPAPVTTSP